MQGFTLIEVVIVIVIISLLITIALKYSFINNEILELKNATYGLSSYLAQLKDISYSRKQIDGLAIDQSACAYGLEISSSSYIAKAFITSTIADCDKIAADSYEQLQNSNTFITKNFDLTTSTNYPNIIDEKFSNIQISLTTSSDESCELSSNDVLRDSNILVSFYNPFGDFIIITITNTGGATRKIVNSREIGASQNIYVCLTLKSLTNNEKRLIVINKLGQIKAVLF